MVPWPARIFVQNGISIGSAVFAQLTVERPIPLQWAARFLQTLALPLGGSGPPPNTWYLGLTRIIAPNGISIGSAFLHTSQILCCTRRCQCGRKPQNSPFPLGFRHPAAGGPSHVICSMHKKLVNIARVVSEIS